MISTVVNIGPIAFCFEDILKDEQGTWPDI